MLASLNLALPHCGGRDWGPFWFFLRSGKEQGVFSYQPAHLCAGEASVDFPYRQRWEQWPEDRAGLLGGLRGGGRLNIAGRVDLFLESHPRFLQMAPWPWLPPRSETVEAPCPAGGPVLAVSLRTPLPTPRILLLPARCRFSSESVQRFPA